MYLSISRQLLAVALVAATIVAPSAPESPAVAVTAGRIAPPELTCAACFAVADTGAELLALSAGARRANASTTKMVTALLVVDNAGLNEAVSVSDRAATTGGGGLDLQTGDSYSVRDLLYALLLSSSNDSAVALAEHIAGSEPAFVAAMNDYVDRLGLTDTHFVTSHGLDRPGHYSSARDLARIAQAVLRQDTLADIVATPEIEVAGPDGLVPVENRNPLLETYKGAVGVKTGFTGDAGNVLVAAAERSGRRVIAVVMGSVDAAADATRLLDYSFHRLARGVLIRRDLVVGSLLLDPGGTRPIVTGATLRGITDPRTVSVEFRPDDDALDDASGSGTVGSVVAISDGHVVGSVPAFVIGPSPDATEPSMLSKMFMGLLSLGHSAADALGAT